MKVFNLFGIPISSLDFDESIARVGAWARQRNGACLVSFSNVHMITEGHDNPAFRAIHRSMDMNCPDGMPLVWLGKVQTGRVRRVSGPDFMRRFCAETARWGLRHFFYGGDEDVNRQVIAQLQAENPGIVIAGSLAPPFRPLTEEEDEEVVQTINRSKADLVWVCLGCPKQEMWIHEHRNRLNVGVILAVGQAFNITAGDTRRAPAIMRDFGFEWLYRLICEPGRLGRRYLYSNSLFLQLVFSHFVLRLISPNADGMSPRLVAEEKQR
jgi:N-acetylglucosaminyldiphosphoundecaprenol N-acetyl-beta-D-mannosaminyltransferase